MSQLILFAGPDSGRSRIDAQIRIAVHRLLPFSSASQRGALQLDTRAVAGRE